MKEETVPDGYTELSEHFITQILAQIQIRLLDHMLVSWDRDSFHQNIFNFPTDDSKLITCDKPLSL